MHHNLKYISFIAIASLDIGIKNQRHSAICQRRWGVSSQNTVVVYIITLTFSFITAYYS